MEFSFDITEVNDKEELILRKEKLGVRDDWHEPDEQGVTVMVTGDNFDNAGVGNEMKVLVMKEGVPIFGINLATLFSLATKE